MFKYYNDLLISKSFAKNPSLLFIYLQKYLIYIRRVHLQLNCRRLNDHEKNDVIIQYDLRLILILVHI